MNNVPISERQIKFKSYAVSMEEVPDEITLVFNISGCDHCCPGCHSDYLWEWEGYNLAQEMRNIVKFYENLVTCVCFMGGDYNTDEIINACRLLHEFELKTCVYSGSKEESDVGRKYMNELGDCIDYLKLGPYMDQLGGLSSSKTNQRMYDANGNNITWKFWKKAVLGG